MYRVSPLASFMRASASLGRTTPKELPTAVSLSSIMRECYYGCNYMTIGSLVNADLI